MYIETCRSVPIFPSLEFSVIWPKMGTVASLHTMFTSVELTDFTYIAHQLHAIKGRNNHKESVLCRLHLIKYTDTIINQSCV